MRPPTSSYVFPAHAGMSLHGADLRLNRTSFPRSRGDEPARSAIYVTHYTFSPLTRG